MLFRNHDKAHYDALGGAEGFPFDAKLNKRYMSRVEGLDKLCYVPDRELASLLYEMFWTLAPAPERDRNAEAKHAEELEWLGNVATSSLSGAFGQLVRKEAERWLLEQDGSVTDDEARLRTWLTKVKNMDWRSHADATKRISR